MLQSPAQYVELIGALLLVAATSFLLLTVAITYLRTGVPTLASARAAQLDVARYLRRAGARRIYELGSGKGDFALRLAKEIPNAHIFGLELSFFPYIYSQLWRLLHPARRRVHFRLVNFHKVDLSSADAVAFYLMPGPNKKLQPKLVRELKKGAIVATVSFSMQGWKPEVRQIANNFSKTRSFIYRMPPTLVH